jgi:hypothetical protein
VLTNVDHLEDVMSTGLIIVIVVVVVLVVAALVVLPGQMRSRRLKNRFGPEYDRAMHNADDQRAAERALAEREQRHSRFELRQLSDSDRTQYLQRWSTIQERFVDAPAEAVRAADGMVTEVMAKMGYPTEDGFDQRADDLSVRYAHDVDKYREAHELAADTDAAGTDGLRRALLNYRELVDSMLGADHEPAATRDGVTQDDATAAAGPRTQKGPISHD